MIWLHSSVALLAASIYWLVEHPALQDLRGSYVIMGTAAMVKPPSIAGPRRACPPCLPA